MVRPAYIALIYHGARSKHWSTLESFTVQATSIIVLSPCSELQHENINLIGTKSCCLFHRFVRKSFANAFYINFHFVPLGDFGNQTEFFLSGDCDTCSKNKESSKK